MKCAAIVLVLAGCGGATHPTPTPTPKPTTTPVAPLPAKPISLTGFWLGEIAPGLRVQIHLDLARVPPTCTLDSLDQGAVGVPCSNVVASASGLSLDVPSVGGELKGTVSADGNTVTATWSQGGEQPLVLTRQAAATKAPFDPAMPPVALDKLQAVLDADLAAALTGRLDPTTGVGVVIGVVDHGVRKVFPYGAAKPDSVFEIGSVTKVFTGLALAQMAQQKKVRLDEPIRALMPKGTITAPASGAEITLLDLSVQRSGLPRMPDNMNPANIDDPYAEYDATALYAFMAQHGVEMPATPEVGYSNLGVGLLGQLLADRAGMTFDALVKQQITAPLGMRDTALALTPAQMKRFVLGHDEDGKPHAAWSFKALAGAGGLHSTAADMLTFLEAQLHPERVKGKTAAAKSLPAAIAQSHEMRAEATGGTHIALNWFRDGAGRYFHNGATGGFSSFAIFDPEKDFAVVVLYSRTTGDTSFADLLGMHIVQRLTGRPAVILEP